MKYLELTLDSPEANLACDEALLDACEDAENSEVLRVWEPREPFVVLGYANRAADEANLEACRASNVPVLRRCSGGGTVLQSDGCLNYTLLLRIDQNPACESIPSTNSFVMQAHRAMMASLLGVAVAIEGSTDLAIDGVKFSGNAQRRKRRALLFHGTFLLNIDLMLIERWLRAPSKQPEYRRNRPHRDFVRNLAIPSNRVKEALRRTWQAHTPLRQVPWSRIERLVKDRYGSDEWNFKF